MAYCDADDIRALLPTRDISATTKPTTTQVGEMIDQIDGEIDSLLASMGYTVPVTTPSYFTDYLKLVNGYGAGALVEAGIFPQTSGMGETPHSGWLRDLYEQAMKGLKDGSMIPSSLDRSGADTQVVGYATEQADYDTYPGPAFLKLGSDDNIDKTRKVF